MIILDTHVFIWWVSNSEKLPKKLKDLIKGEREKGSVLISSISIWEIYMLIKKGRLELTVDTDSWLEMLENIPKLTFIPVDNQIASKSTNLPGDFHGDPADRMIVATAAILGATVITADEKIRKYAFINSIW